MKNKNMLTRRQALHLSLGATAGLLTTSLTGNQTTGLECQSTPEQVLGPFYPITDQEDEDVDLTIVKGHSERAAGEVLYVRGQVMDEDCNPIEGALVELWQANSHGRYHHERDNSKAKLDPNFQGWGETPTKADGTYGFKTIKPGSYGLFASARKDGDFRTPHLHFKVSRRGYHEVITQMYFAGEKLNDTDLILLNLPKAARPQVVIAAEADPAAKEEGIPVYQFNLVLKQVKKPVKVGALEGIPGKYKIEEGVQKTKTLTIRQIEQQLFVDLPGYTSVELKLIGKDHFSARPVGREYRFQRNEDGSVASVSFQNIGSGRNETMAKKIS